MKDDSKLPPRGRFRRFRKLAQLSAEVGAEVLAKGVQRFAGGEGDWVSRKTAERIVETLGDLKGAAMKVGQAASMDPDLFGPEVRAVLARLQNQAPPMPFATVKSVVEAELGKGMDELFLEFCEEPAAAASLGQVHRATLPSGELVAVKVQYPGVEEALSSDLENVSVLARVLSAAHRAVDGRAYVEELRQAMLLELDYRQEALHAEELAKVASGLLEVKIPFVARSHTAQRVLTLEWISGQTLGDFARSQASNSDRFRVSRQLLYAVYGPFLLAGELHADPHPGNFLVMPDGRLGVVDFGSKKRFSPPFAQALADLFRSAAAGKRASLLPVCRTVGFTFDLPDLEAEALLSEAAHIAGRPLRVEEYDFARCEMAQDLRALATKNAARLLRIRPPAEGVLFGRALGGCTHNLRALGARGPFAAVYRELAELRA